MGTKTKTVALIAAALCVPLATAAVIYGIIQAKDKGGDSNNGGNPGSNDQGNILVSENNLSLKVLDSFKVDSSMIKEEGLKQLNEAENLKIEYSQDAENDFSFNLDRDDSSQEIIGFTLKGKQWSDKSEQVTFYNDDGKVIAHITIEKVDYTLDKTNPTLLSVGTTTEVSISETTQKLLETNPSWITNVKDNEFASISYDTTKHVIDLKGKAETDEDFFFTLVDDNQHEFAKIEVTKVDSHSYDYVDSISGKVFTDIESTIPDSVKDKFNNGLVWELEDGTQNENVFDVKLNNDGTKIVFSLKAVTTKAMNVYLVDNAGEKFGVITLESTKNDLFENGGNTSEIQGAIRSTTKFDVTNTIAQGFLNKAVKWSSTDGSSSDKPSSDYTLKYVSGDNQLSFTWIKHNDTPQTLTFTNEDGIDFATLTITKIVGNVIISDSISANVKLGMTSYKIDDQEVRDILEQGFTSKSEEVNADEYVSVKYNKNTESIEFTPIKRDAGFELVLNDSNGEAFASFQMTITDQYLIEEDVTGEAFKTNTLTIPQGQITTDYLEKGNFKVELSGADATKVTTSEIVKNGTEWNYNFVSTEAVKDVVATITTTDGTGTLGVITINKITVPTLITESVNKFELQKQANVDMGDNLSQYIDEYEITTEIEPGKLTDAETAAIQITVDKDTKQFHIYADEKISSLFMIDVLLAGTKVGSIVVNKMEEPELISELSGPQTLYGTDSWVVDSTYVQDKMDSGQFNWEIVKQDGSKITGDEAKEKIKMQWNKDNHTLSAEFDVVSDNAFDINILSTDGDDLGTIRNVTVPVDLSDVTFDLLSGEYTNGQVIQHHLYNTDGKLDQLIEILNKGDFAINNESATGNASIDPLKVETTENGEDVTITVNGNVGDTYSADVIIKKDMLLDEPTDAVKLASIDFTIKSKTTAAINESITGLIGDSMHTFSSNDSIATSVQSGNYDIKDSDGATSTALKIDYSPVLGVNVSRSATAPTSWSDKATIITVYKSATDKSIIATYTVNNLLPQSKTISGVQLVSEGTEISSNTPGESQDLLEFIAVQISKSNKPHLVLENSGNTSYPPGASLDDALTTTLIGGNVNIAGFIIKPIKSNLSSIFYNGEQMKISVEFDGIVFLSLGAMAVFD